MLIAPGIHGPPDKLNSKSFRPVLQKVQIASTVLLELLSDEEHLHEGLPILDRLELLAQHRNNRLKTQPCLLFFIIRNIFQNEKIENCRIQPKYEKKFEF